MAGISKIVYGGETLIDLTGDDVTPEKLLEGTTAHGKDGDKITGTIPSKSAQTYTPSTVNQTISSGTYLSGTQTIKGDSNLVASNIKKGVSIFSVSGTYEGSGGGSTGGETVTGTLSFASLSGTVEYQSPSGLATIDFVSGDSLDITVVVGSTLTVWFDMAAMGGFCEGYNMTQYELHWNSNKTAFMLIVPNENFYCSATR